MLGTLSWKQRADGITEPFSITAMTFNVRCNGLVTAQNETLTMQSSHFTTSGKMTTSDIKFY